MITESASAIPFSAPPAWRRWLAYVTAALMPLSINIERVLGPQKKPDYYGPFDLILPALILLMIVDLVTRRPWARLKFPSPAAIAWVGVGVLSFLWLQGGEGALMEWLKAAANPLIVVMLASWVFSNIADDPAEFRRLALCLLGSFGVCVLWALWQYMGPVGRPYSHADPSALASGTTNIRLGGFYDNRMLFAAQAAMLLPAAAAFAALDKDPIVKALAALLAAIALCVTMAVGGFAAAMAGILAVGAACIADKKYVAGLGLLAGVLIVVVVVIPRLPEKRSNGPTLMRGLALFAKKADNPDEKFTTPRLRRYQAALDFLSAHRNPRDPKTLPNWIFGAGAGSYNAKVNEFYDDKYYPKPGARTDEESRFDIEGHERHGFGLIEKTGVELGAVGLAVLVFLFATWLIASAGSFMRAQTPDMKLLALAALGACVGAAVVSVFAFPIQRAASGSTFAFFFGLSTWLTLR